MIIDELWRHHREIFPYYNNPNKTWLSPMYRISSHMKPLYEKLQDNKKGKRKEEKTGRKNNTSDQINSI